MSSRRFRWCRAFVALVTAFSLGGCSTWRTQSGPPQVVIGEQPDQIRLSLADGSRLIVYYPAIDDDRLVAWTRSDRIGSPDASVPLAEIRSVEVRKISPGRTIALATAVGVGVTLLVMVIALSRAEFGFGDDTRFSCPFIYSDTGTGWRLDSGTFGGAIMRSLRRTDVDNLDFARPRDGVLALKLANELPETDYVDAIDVLAVDHPRGTTVAPAPDGTLHAMGRLAPPVRARDFAGRDVLPIVGDADDWNWESRLEIRDPDSASIRDGLDLWFIRPAGATSARLVVDARNTPWSAFLLGAFVAAHGRDTPDWYRALDAEPARAAQMQAFLAREAFLRVSVETEHGWQESGVLWEVGPEVVKRQVIPIDLTAISGDAVHVRLDAPASFWLVDHVALDTGDEPPFSVRTLVPRPPTESASRDVFGRIAAVDGRELRLETGDAIELHFDVPPPSPDATRSFLARSTGWYRIHTPESGEPDTALLDSVMTPGGVARTSAMWMNTALAQLQARDPAR